MWRSEREVGKRKGADMGKDEERRELAPPILYVNRRILRVRFMQGY